MPVLGLLLGHGFASALGQAAHWIGAALLIATGTYGLIQAARRPVGVSLQVADRRLGRLLVTGIALSIDNLAVGFALGTYHVSLVLAAVIIGVVSVALSLAGLELGAKIGARTGRYGEFFGGLVLIAVGIAVAAGIV